MKVGDKVYCIKDKHVIISNSDADNNVVACNKKGKFYNILAFRIDKNTDDYLSVSVEKEYGYIFYIYYFYKDNNYHNREARTRLVQDYFIVEPEEVVRKERELKLKKINENSNC